MTYMNARLGLLSATAVAALACAGSAWAAADEQPGSSGVGSPAAGASSGAPVIEEVVVTARRREERLVDVPVAVTAVSRTRLEQFHATDLQSIATLAPNVDVRTASSGTGGTIAIRGVGSAAGDAGIDQSVVVNVDNVPVDHGQIVNTAFFDLQDVEVLKGPQTLFFGKNSPAGALILTSVDPDGGFSGYLRVGYEARRDRPYSDGAVSFPISSTLSGRIAFQASQGIGFNTNVAQPYAVPAGSTNYPVGTILPGALAKHETDKDIAGRLTLKWKPSDQFTATLKLLASDHESRNALGGVTKCITGISPQNHIAVNGFVDPFSTCHLDRETSLGVPPTIVAQGYPQSNNGHPFYSVKSQLGSLTLDYDVGAIDVTSVTGIYHYSNRNFAQFASDIDAYYEGVNDENNTTYTEEVHFSTKLSGPFQFTGGLYLEHGKRLFYIVPHLSPIVNPPGPQGQTYTAIAHMPTKNDTYSPFIEGRWKITPDLELAGGARYTHEKRTGDIGYDYVNPASILARLGILLPAGTYIHNDLRSHAWDPQATLTWHPSEGWTLYGAYKTGFKSGGITNPTVITAGFKVNPTTFKPEKVKGEEAGLKWDLMGHTIAGSLTAFRYNFSDLQVSSFNQTTVTYVIQNAARSRTQGVELQNSWQATDRLSLAADISYTDAHYVSFPGAQCYTGQNIVHPGSCLPGGQDLSGKQLPQAPKWQIIADAYYNQPLAADLMLRLSAEVSYRSKYYESSYIQDYLVQRSFALLNASARLTKEGQPWELAVIGKNLTNKLYVISAQDIVSGQVGNEGYTLGDPRTIAIQATYRW